MGRLLKYDDDVEEYAIISHDDVAAIFSQQFNT